MSAHDEIREYLRHLLDHQGKCQIENCATCRVARNVYELIRSQIFSVRDYPVLSNAVDSPVTDGDGRASDAPGTTTARRG